MGDSEKGKLSLLLLDLRKTILAWHPGGWCLDRRAFTETGAVPDRGRTLRHSVLPAQVLLVLRTWCLNGGAGQRRCVLRAQMVGGGGFLLRCVKERCAILSLAGRLRRQLSCKVAVSWLCRGRLLPRNLLIRVRNCTAAGRL